jgi:FkbM family methyltransferase
MIKKNLLHFAHKLKRKMQNKKPFTGRGLLIKFADIIIDNPSKPIQVKTLHGFKMFIDPVTDKGVERSIYYTGTYEAGTLHIFDYLLSEGDVYFDIGANIGLMAIYASQRIKSSGRVHAFEPEPDTFGILQKNCAINHIKNITLNRVALGEENKKALIFPNLDINRGASSLVRNDGSAGKEVTVMSLDNYIGQYPDPIKLMKIDVEGYEMEMLKGAGNLLKSAMAPIICIEYSKETHQNGDVADLYEFVKNVNEYRIYKFKGWKGEVGTLTEVYRREEMPDHDNVFCFLPKHLENVDKNIFK